MRSRWRAAHNAAAILGTAEVFTGKLAKGEIGGKVLMFQSQVWVVRSEGGRIRCDFNRLPKWAKNKVRFKLRKCLSKRDTQARSAAQCVRIAKNESPAVRATRRKFTAPKGRR